MNELTPRVAELHRLAEEDYAKGRSERAAAHHPLPAYTPFATASAITPPPAPTDLDIAIHVAQQMLATYGDASTLGDIFAFAQAHGGLTEALRILLRALGAEPQDGGR
ncbi:hypothetical protein [Streptomyces sp. NPDC048663]|uniref:hypothetical protein n=1 Tax=Streptomyces sp. NPDC048663 TaxID=3155638 RepID=UPI0034390B35